MEILIVGLILVALMAYASTRIKRTAAAAFGEESIDTELFSLEKPDGFLNVVTPANGLLFEGYSKGFGNGVWSNIRMARIELRKYVGKTVANAIADIKATEKVTSELAEVISERKYHVVEAERVVKGVGYRVRYKLAATGSDVYEFQIAALEETNADETRKMDTMLDSFLLK